MRRLIVRLATLGSILAVLALGAACGTPQTPTDNKTDGTTGTTTDNSNALTSSLIDLRITDKYLGTLNALDKESKSSDVYENVTGSTTSYRKLLWSYGMQLDVPHQQILQEKYTQVDDYVGTDGYWGECVSFVKALSETTVPTGDWSPGKSALDGSLDGSIMQGTVVATFSGKDHIFISGTDHTAIYKGTLADGFEVWDQNWDGTNKNTPPTGAVGTHEIKTKTAKTRRQKIRQNTLSR